MTERWAGRRARQRRVAVETRADWRGLIELARHCIRDLDGEPDFAGETRLLDLSRRAKAASVDMWGRDAGATATEVARAFLILLVGFGRWTSPKASREALAPLIEASAGWLEDRMHELATDEFKRAHAGRPEVWG